VLVLGVVVAGAATLVAQQRPNFSNMDNNQAREITQLIEQGQIGLHEAIRLAETKANGKALECFTQLEFGSPDMGQPGGKGELNKPTGAADRPGQPGATTPGTAGKPTMDKDAKRVVYHVRVFADGNLTPYMVDAKSKEVTEIGDRFKQTSDRPILDKDKD
jgi:hypothetical protein